MTLAELLAMLGMCAPGNLRALDPIVAAVPLLAQRLGASIEDVYAMPVRTVADAVAVSSPTGFPIPLLLKPPKR